MRNTRTILTTAALLGVVAAAANAAPISLSNASPSASENFNSLFPSPTPTGAVAVTWANDSTLPGWYFNNVSGTVGGTGTTSQFPTQYTFNNGNNSAGALSLGTTPNATPGSAVDTTGTDRAFGSRNSGSTGNIRFGAVCKNTGTTEITGITVAYTGEQWRQDVISASPVSTPSNGNDKFDFAYKTSANLPVDGVDALGGTFTDVDTLDFLSPQPLLTTGSATNIDGNASANRTSLSSTISFATPVPVNAYFVLRWFDFNTLAGTNTAINDNSLGVDDLTVTATFAAPVPEPTTLAAIALLAPLALRRSRIA
jgi:hypothetical protein